MNTTAVTRLKLRERITRGTIPPASYSPPGVAVRVLVSGHLGASGMSAGTATFEPRAELPYRDDECSKAFTLLAGNGSMLVDGRVYEMGVFDSIHIPPGVAHSLRNESESARLLAHWAFACSEPSPGFVEPSPVRAVRVSENREPVGPEHISRFSKATPYELSPGALFRDLFKGSLGSVGICGGYGRFRPGSSLPCHFHEYDESITIVEGTALCLVEGNRYQVDAYDTAFVPVGRPHRFINESDTGMAMIWVYAGSEPERTVIEPEYCNGTLPWLGPAGFQKS